MAEDVSRSRRGRREYLNDGKTREFMALLENFFNILIDIPRMKHGVRQSIISLINEETMLLGKYLRQEEKMWIPRISVP